MIDRKRFTTNEAKRVARAITERGFDAQAITIAQGMALVEVRSKQRPYPVVATLRTEEDARLYLAEEGTL